MPLFVSALCILSSMDKHGVAAEYEAMFVLQPHREPLSRAPTRDFYYFNEIISSFICFFID